MQFTVDAWIRKTDSVHTRIVTDIARSPDAWTDADVAAVLRAMLRVLDRAANPEADPNRDVFLRGFSWIVNPFEEGGVVIAIEMQAGAVIGGPFHIDRTVLSGMVTRVMAAEGFGAPRSNAIH